MRFRLYGIALGVFFALGLVFSFGVESSAQTIKRADQVTDKKDEMQIREFLSYVVEAFDDINDRDISDAEKNRELIILGNKFRQDNGEYRNEDLYTLGINGSNSVTNHPGHPELYAYDFDKTSSSTVTDTLNKLIENSGVGVESMVCEEYGQEKRYACAVKVGSPAGLVTVVAGLHHTYDDRPFSLPALCEGLMLDNNATAADVVDEASLKAYVKDVIKESQELVAGIVNKVIMDEGGPPDTPEKEAAFQIKVTQELYRIAACFGQGDLKHENIYSFIMDTGEKGTVFLNGNDFGLNGLDLDVTDPQLPGDMKVSTLFRNALTCGSGGAPQKGDYATVYYRWDDPENDNDEPGSQDGTIPGTSDKTGYIEVADLFESVGGGQLYIFGSGIYPSGGNPDTPEERYICAEAETKTDDDDGCAIAGTGHTPQGALLNLLLTASVLFSVVFLRRRA